MLLNPKDCTVTVEMQKVGTVCVSPRMSYVKICHNPTGITVTKIEKSQIKAKDKALEELEFLLELWGE